ncbi:MAG: hypothetical protein COB54_01475 [Alphaproteobacteria bacterium]|nr:MAG: hypothetical protein COB54_01475 [Alphaproteobacteria bacterium]
MTINEVQLGAGKLLGRENLNKTEQENMLSQRLQTVTQNVSPSQDSTPKDTVAISNVWSRAARDIDVTNATPREMMTLSSALYTAGAISYDDHINLSFQPEVNLDSPLESTPFSFERKDYIAQWHNKQDNVIRSGGDRYQIEETHRIQAILAYVDSLE